MFVCVCMDFNARGVCACVRACVRLNCFSSNRILFKPTPVYTSDCNPTDLPVTCEAPAVNAGDIGRVTYHLNRDVTEIPFPVSLSVEFYPDKQNGSGLSNHLLFLFLS